MGQRVSITPYFGTWLLRSLLLCLLPALATMAQAQDITNQLTAVEQSVPDSLALARERSLPYDSFHGSISVALDIINFENLETGMVVDSLYSSGGFGPIHVNGKNDEETTLNAAVIFDSTCPGPDPQTPRCSGGDFDLGSPNSDFGGPGIDNDTTESTLGGKAGSNYENREHLGKILIVNEVTVKDKDGNIVVDKTEKLKTELSNLKVTDPNDAHVGTSITIKFPEAVTLYSFDVLDRELKETQNVELLNQDSTLIKKFETHVTGDNGLETYLTDLDSSKLGTGTPGVVWIIMSHKGSGGLDNIVFLPPSSPPSSSITLEATAGDMRADLVWDTTTASADSYTLYRTLAPTDSSALTDDDILATGLQDTTYSDMPLDNGTTYYYRVKAIVSDTVSVFSNEVSATPEPVPPKIGEISFNPRFPLPSDTVTVTVNITDDDDNLDSTRVFILWSRNDITQADILMMPTAGAFVGKILPPQPAGSEVTFRIEAFDLKGNMDESADTSYTVNFNLEATAGDMFVGLNWTPPAAGADSYTLYRTLASTEITALTDEDIRDAGLTDTTFTDMPLDNDTTYYYRVAAVGEGEIFAYSNEAGARPADVPPVITDVEYQPRLACSGDNITISAIVTDEDGNLISSSVKIVWSRNDVVQPSIAMNQTQGDTFVGILDPQPDSSLITFYIEAADAKMNEARSNTVSFTTCVEREIEVRPIPDATLILGCPILSVDLDTVFVDPFNEPLSYQSDNQNAAIAELIEEGNLLDVKQKITGRTTVMVTATNPSGSVARDTFVVSVDSMLADTVNVIPNRDTAHTVRVRFRKKDSTGAVTAASVEGATIYYRRGGDASYINAAMSPSPADAEFLEFTIPFSMVTDRGVEYYIETPCPGSGSLRFPASRFFSLRVYIPEPGLISTVLPDSVYRIISIPLELDNSRPQDVFGDDFGDYDIKEWRFFDAFHLDQDDKRTLKEYNEIDSLKSRTGYWVIRRSGLKGNDTWKFDTGAGTTNLTSEPDSNSIQLYAGWSLIANPFTFSIPWSKLYLNSIEEGNQIDRQNLYRYDGGSVKVDVDSLKPFEGYAFYVNDDYVLLIDPDLTDSTASSSFEAPADETAWSIDVHAESGKARDVLTRASIVPGAARDFDRRDRPEPPAIGEYVSVYFSHPEWLSKTATSRFREDARPEPIEGEVWDIEVIANTHEVVDLTFEGLETVPPAFDVSLWDPVLNWSQDLRRQPTYTLGGVGEQQPRALKLIVGTRDYLEKKVVETEEQPASYELAQNFPNPFNPSTTITFSVPESTPVRLTIYNVLGEPVAILLNGEDKQAGRHSVVWDGRDDEGHVVASGLYFIRMQAGRFEQVRKALLVK